LVYSIAYKRSIEKDLRRIDRTAAWILVAALETQLAKDPHAGRALTGEFDGLYRVRVGNYQMIYSIHGNVVLVLMIVVA
jgi:mRNA interferase RelE/StbE